MAKVTSNEAISGSVGAIAGAVITVLVTVVAGCYAEDRRSQESRVQTYLDDVGELLVDNSDNMLAGGSEVPENALVRAKTVGLVEDIDPTRRTTIVGFLYDTSLIGVPPAEAEDSCSQAVSEDARPPVRLGRARLDGIALSNSDLTGIGLSNTYLSRANFYYANMPQSNLHYTVMRQANLNRVSFKCANLSWSDLQLANLSRSDLSYADLSHSDLRGASLYLATLNNTNLEGARNLTQEQVEQAYGNGETTLPDDLKRPSAWVPDEQAEKND